MSGACVALGRQVSANFERLGQRRDERRDAGLGQRRSEEAVKLVLGFFFLLLLGCASNVADQKLCKLGSK